MLVEIAHRFNVEKEVFDLCGAKIPMIPSDVYHIMEIPVDGEEIALDNQTEISNDLFLSYKSQAPGDNHITLKSLEQRIINSKAPDDHFIRQFVLYTIGLILAPTTKDYVDAKYLSIVEKVNDIGKYNWGQFTLRDLLSSIRSFKLGEQVNLQGNLALLQVSATLLVPFIQCGALFHYIYILIHFIISIFLFITSTGTGSIFIHIASMLCHTRLCHTHWCNDGMRKMLN